MLLLLLLLQAAITNTLCRRSFYGDAIRKVLTIALHLPVCLSLCNDITKKVQNEDITTLRYYEKYA